MPLVLVCHGNPCMMPTLYGRIVSSHNFRVPDIPQGSSSPVPYPAVAPMLIFTAKMCGASTYPSHPSTRQDQRRNQAMSTCSGAQWGQCLLSPSLRSPLPVESLATQNFECVVFPCEHRRNDESSPVTTDGFHCSFEKSDHASIRSVLHGPIE